MSENYIFLFFYTRQQEEIYDPDKYQQLIDGLVVLQFSLPGEGIDQKMLTAPGISQDVQKDIQEAHENGHALVFFRAYSQEC